LNQEDGDEDDLEITAPEYSVEEQCSDAAWGVITAHAARQGMPLIVAAVNQCDAGMVKRALMNDNNEDMNMVHNYEYLIHYAALRREPANAVEIISLLMKHGACPNVYRGDGMHLLGICRQRAKWIDDDTPNMENIMHRLGNFGSVEAAERAESDELVALVTEAIKKHKRCECCKAENRLQDNTFLEMDNMTDSMGLTRKQGASAPWF
jgi:hypothetical protein